MLDIIDSASQFPRALFMCPQVYGQVLYRTKHLPTLLPLGVQIDNVVVPVLLWWYELDQLESNKEMGAHMNVSFVLKAWFRVMESVCQVIEIYANAVHVFDTN